MSECQFKQLVNNNILQISNNIYECAICNKFMHGLNDVFTHIKQHQHYSQFSKEDIYPTKHSWNGKLEKNIYRTTTGQTNKKWKFVKKSSYNSSQKLSTRQDNLLNSVHICKSIEEQLWNERIRKHRMPNTNLQENNRNKIQVDHDYSSMILETGSSNIFNVSIEKLQKIKLGIELLSLVHNKSLCLICNEEIPNNIQHIYEHLLNIDHINNLDQLIDNDLEFENHREQFSDLALAKEFVIEIDEKIVFCFACEKEIRNNDNIIKQHLENDENHLIACQYPRHLTEEIFKSLSDQLNTAWYFVQRFWCVFCNEKFEYDIDFVKHLKKEKHFQEVKQSSSNEISSYFHICIPCAGMSFGPPESFTKHCEVAIHKYLVRSNDFAVPQLTKSAKNLLQNVEEISENLVLQANEGILEEKNITFILECMEKTVKSQYPEAKAYVFGSRASNLAFTDSDVDVFLDCGNSYNIMQLLSTGREYLLNAQKCFESQPDLWDLKKVFLNVRSPMIRIHNRELRLNCNVSFMNGLTVETSKIVKLIMSSCPPCRKMILFLKKWLKLCSLVDSQGLTTFGITWIVIFYFQQIEIIPSIATLINDKSQSKLVAGWETGFAEQIPIKHSSLTFKELLTGFFKFYANFDYRTRVISPLLGNIFYKQDFTDNRLPYLPVEMQSYSRYLKSTFNPEIFRIDSPLCLQDPIDLSQNITKSVSKLALRCFIQYCQTSADILSNSP